MKKIKTALISVSDKKNLEKIGQYLSKLGIKILSTGGSAKALQNSGIEVTEVSEHTGFPEILDGRVKTLNPIIHGGILARRNDTNHIKTITQHNIELIDLVIINLYPFVKTISKPDTTLNEAIENIDIGGPAMIRSSAKNYEDVAIVTDPNDYDQLKQELENNNGSVTVEFKKNLAIKAFEHTSKYDEAIFQYLNGDRSSSNGDFPEKLIFSLQKSMDMRYGENPH